MRLRCYLATITPIASQSDARNLQKHHLPIALSFLCNLTQNKVQCLQNTVNIGFQSPNLSKGNLKIVHITYW